MGAFFLPLDLRAQARGKEVFSQTRSVRLPARARKGKSPPGPQVDYMLVSPPVLQELTEMKGLDMEGRHGRGQFPH